jgi:hypothetical protein
MDTGDVQCRHMRWRLQSLFFQRCKLFFSLLFLLLLAATALAQETFMVRINKVKRVDDGCIAEAQSSTVLYKVRSDVSAACAMLRAGENYEAFRGERGNDPKDDNKDSAILVIYNNVKNPRRQNAVFDIDSEEAVQK